jgi:hypothetical protein
MAARSGCLLLVLVSADVAPSAGSSFGNKEGTLSLISLDSLIPSKGPTPSYSVFHPELTLSIQADQTHSRDWLEAILGPQRTQWEAIKAECLQKEPIEQARASGALLCAPDCFKRKCGENVWPLPIDVPVPDPNNKRCTLPLISGGHGSEAAQCMVNSSKLSPSATAEELVGLSRAAPSRELAPTTVTCVDAFGCKGFCLQTCRFRNLFSSGSLEDKRLFAHVVAQDDDAFAAIALQASLLRRSPVVVVRHPSIKSFTANLTSRYGTNVTFHNGTSVAMSPVSPTIVRMQGTEFNTIEHPYTTHHNSQLALIKQKRELTASRPLHNTPQLALIKQKRELTDPFHAHPLQAIHCNIGHTLYDYLYPTFISLLQLHLEHATYRTILQKGDENYMYGR